MSIGFIVTDRYSGYYKNLKKNIDADRPCTRKASRGFIVILFEMYVLVRKIIAENTFWESIDYSEKIVKQMEPDSQWTIRSRLMERNREIFF